MFTRQFVLRGPPQDGGLRFSIKRYRPKPDSEMSDDSNKISLLFVHGVGTHKETWEPVIEHIFHLQANATIQDVVGEAWAIDAPNHGYTAVLNEDELLHRRDISSYQWGRGIQALLESGLITAQRIVGIGHSAGVVALVLSTLGNSHVYSSIVIIEPPMMTRKLLAEVSEGSPMYQIMESVKTRKDIWTSRDSAREWFRKRYPWKRWDLGAFDLFVKYGLRELPTATYPDIKEGVTLTCTRAQEATGYKVHDPSALSSLDRLSELCPLIPVHCIAGGIHDLVSEESLQGVCSVEEGRSMASITEIPKTGHNVVQEAPGAIAAVIWQVLCGKASHQTSKL